jgi:voltage-gated potassium channel
VTDPTRAPNSGRLLRGSEGLAQLLDWLVIFGALATIPLLIIEQTHLTGPWHYVAEIGDWTVWLIFVLDLLVMLALAKDRRDYLRSHPLDLIVIVLTPPILPVGLQWVRVLRVLRVVRLLRLPRLLKRKLSLETLEYAAVLVALAFFGGAAAFSAAERISYGDAMYWAIGVMTTAGNGDVKVTTTLAKIVAGVLMVVGTGFFALVTGAIAQRFLASEVSNLQDTAEEIGDVATAVSHDEDEILVRVHALSAQVRELEASLSRRAGQTPARLRELD